MIQIYSKENCPHCVTAKELTKSKGLDFEVLMLGVDYSREDMMVLAPKARTVPQVFDDGDLIGGVPELQKYLENR